MTGNIISRRYAKALLEVAKDKKEIEGIEKDLKRIASLIEENPRLSGLLFDPSIDLGFKKGLMEDILGALKAVPVLSRFLDILIEKNRLKHIATIALVFEELSNEAHNRLKAIITTTYSISKDLRERLKEKLSRITKKEVLLEEKIEPSLISGIKVQIGGYTVDGSIKAQLGQLKEELLRGEKT